MNVFENRESNVRSYCRSFPVVFTTAKMDKIHDENGKEYIDFFAGAGALNYGHNNDYIKKQILKYIEQDGISHALDMYTKAKEEFLKTFEDDILLPKGLDYKVMFCGSTGTNAVEAAIKLARKYKKRSNIFSFTGAFHGMTTASLSITSSLESRAGAGTPLSGSTFMPYPFGFFENIDTIGYIDAILSDDHSGIEKPAAIFFETVQAEGGVIVPDVKWIKALRELCDKHDILLVCDDIQVGCGRTGTFFSFERAGIKPDIIALSKSISGYGFPMSLLLFKRELDIWAPAEHNGTFRGNQLSFVSAKAALEYWKNNNMEAETARKAKIVADFLEKEIKPINKSIKTRGIGLIWGIDFSGIDDDACKKIAKECFENGLIIERAGRKDNVLKIMPPLVISDDNLLKGLNIIKNSIIKVLN